METKSNGSNFHGRDLFVRRGRLLTQGSIDEVKAALDLAVVAARWDELDLPWPAAVVWSGVLTRLGYAVPSVQ